VLETIIDSASQATAKDFRAALTKAAKAYKKLDSWEKCSKNRSQSMKQVKAFVDLSYFFDLLDSVEETKKKDEFEEKLREFKEKLRDDEYEHAKDFVILGRLYLECDKEENYEKLITELEKLLGQHNRKGRRAGTGEDLPYTWPMLC